jgi:hypothetical protein
MRCLRKRSSRTWICSFAHCSSFLNFSMSATSAGEEGMVILSIVESKPMKLPCRCRCRTAEMPMRPIPPVFGPREQRSHTAKANYCQHCTHAPTPVRQRYLFFYFEFIEPGRNGNDQETDSNTIRISCWITDQLKKQQFLSEIRSPDMWKRGSHY